MRIKHFRKTKAFTLVEVLLMIVVVSLALAASVSMLTKRQSGAGTDSNTLSCILNNATDFNYDGSGNITGGYPTSGYCYAAYYGCQKGRTDVCNTLYSYADGAGNQNQTISALKILRASCDNGGTQACDYLISRCVGSQANCSSPDSKFTVDYYLNMLSTSSAANAGRSYVEQQGTLYYNWGVATFKNEIDSNICSSCVANKTGCKAKGCP